MNGKPTIQTKLFRTIVILAVVVAAIAVAISISSSNKSADADSLAGDNTCIASRRNLTVNVSESGEVRAREYVDFVSKVRGRVAITSIVAEGAIITEEDVKNGKILCELDTSVLTERLSQQEIFFAGADSAFTNAKEAYLIQLNQNESDIKAAQLAVKFAGMDLQKYLGAPLARQVVEETSDPNDAQGRLAELIDGMIQDPNDMRWSGAALQSKRQFESDIKLASQQLEKNANQLRGTEKLFANDYVASSELERDRLSHSSSIISLDSAKTSLSLFLAYDFPKEVERLYSDYKESQRQLERALASARSLEAQAMAKLKGAEATFNLQKQRLDRLVEQIDACVIRASAVGMVIYGSGGSYRRREPIEIGTEVYERQLIIRIPNMNEMAAKVQVHESWIDKVKLDQPVRIVVDAFPDTQFTGKVLKIAPLPDPQYRWVDTSLKVYITLVSLEGDYTGLRPGMSAKVQITIEQLEDVVCIPVQAVVNRKGFKACYVVTDKGMELRPIKTGAFNDSYIQIIDGVEESEVISLSPPPLTGNDRQNEIEKEHTSANEPSK